MDSMAKKPKNVTKSAVSPFALFAQSQSLILLLLLHFSIFLLDILKLASQLNLAVVLLIGFLNFEFGFILTQFPGNFFLKHLNKIVSYFTSTSL